MIRSTVVILLVANLLACPLRCLSCGIDASVSDVTATQKSHGCCQACELSIAEDSSQETSSERDTSEEDTSPQATLTRDEDSSSSSQTPNRCSCHSCICEGATIESLSSLTDDAAFCFDWLMPFNSELSSGDFAQTTAALSDPPTARMQLAVHQVWRI